MGRSRKYVLVDELNALESESSLGIVDKSVVQALAGRGSLLRVNADEHVDLVHRGMTARDRYVDCECDTVRWMAYELSRTCFLARLPLPIKDLLTRSDRLRLLYCCDKPIAHIKVFNGVTARVYGHVSDQYTGLSTPSHVTCQSLPSQSAPKQSVSGQFLVTMLTDERLAQQEYIGLTKGVGSTSSDLRAAVASISMASGEQSAGSSRPSLGQSIGQSIGQYIGPQRGVKEHHKNGADGRQGREVRQGRDGRQGRDKTACNMDEKASTAVTDALPDAKQDELDCKRESFDLATAMIKGSSHENYVALIRNLVLGYLLNNPDAFHAPGLIPLLPSVSADGCRGRRDLVQYMRNSVTLVMLGLRFVGRTFAGSLILRLLTSMVADLDRYSNQADAVSTDGRATGGDGAEEEEVHWVPDSSGAGPITIYMVHGADDRACPVVYASSTLPLTRRSMTQEGRRFEASCLALLHGGNEEVGRLGDLLGLPSPVEINEEMYPVCYYARSPDVDDDAPSDVDLQKQTEFAGLYRVQATKILDTILSRLSPRPPPSDPTNLNLVATFLTQSAMVRFSTQTCQ